MKKFVSTIVFGASSAGLGYVLNHEDAILLEENELLGNDYTNVFRPSGLLDRDHVKTEIAKQLLQYMDKSGITQENKLDSLRYVATLNRFVQDHHLLGIYLDSALISIQNAEVEKDGNTYLYEVTFRSNSGINTVYAKQLLDTTHLHITEREAVTEEERILSAFVHHHNDDLSPVLENAAKKFTDGKVINPELGCVKSVSYRKMDYQQEMKDNEPTTEYFICLHLNPGTDDLTARKALEAFHREFLFNDTLFDAVGFDFDYVCKKAEDQEMAIEWIPPHDYEDPLSAFDAGAAYEIGSPRKLAVKETEAQVGPQKLTYYELKAGESVAQEAAPVFESHYDAIVCGMGSTGSFCAYAIGREGGSVLGLERGNCVGGMSVQGCVNTYYSSCRGGAYEKADAAFANKLESMYSTISQMTQMDAKKVSMSEMLEEVGVKTCFHSIIVGIYADGNQIVGVKALIRGKLVNIGCSFLADGTSDGHLIRIVGMKGIIGRPTDGTIQPFSSVRVLRRPNGNIARTNEDSGMIDIYDDDDFSRSVIIAHGKQNKDSLSKKERFLYVAPQIGIREGILMESEQYITLKDMLDETEWPNVLTYGFSDIDRHGLDRAFDDALYQDWYVLSNMCTVNLKFAIPVGAMVPKGWKGFVSASRCIGADNYASSAIRMNRDMYRIGEATGVAVGMAIQSGLNSIMDVPYEPLHEKIENYHCGDSEPYGRRVWVVWGKDIPHHGWYPFEWLTKWEEMTQAMSTDRPAVALWCCRRMHLGLDTLYKDGKVCEEAVSDLLAQLLDPAFVEEHYSTMNAREKKNLRLNAAIALGLIMDERAIPTLREMVYDRTDYFYQDNRRSNALRSVNAICMLGRFHDLDILPELYKIMTPREYYKPMYHRFVKNCYKFSIDTKMNMIYYWFLIYTVQAMIEISKKYPEKREDIFKVLHKMTEKEDFRKRITFGQEVPFDSPEDRRIRGIREWVDLQESRLSK